MNSSFVIRAVCCVINIGCTIFNFATGAVSIGIVTLMLALFCGVLAAMAYKPQISTRGRPATR